MRSSTALRLLRSSSRGSHAGYRDRRKPLLFRNGYCSACEPEPNSPWKAATAATPTSPVPIPSGDHRQLAIEQELFITSKYSPGSPLFLPNGAKMFNKLTNFLRTQYADFGFEEVITPTIYKKSLWEKSGHWENYAEDMYAVTGRGASGETKGRQAEEDEEYGLKPMNCPGHCLIFASKKRSYRDLPIRYADFSPLHRNEVHGALSGLTRVRRFHQDDGHIFCRPSQIQEEISRTLEFVQLAYKTFSLGSYRLALSTRPADNFIGSIEEWDNAEAALRKSLVASGQRWVVNDGDGAFYGPKIDVILKDSDGKEHQTATIQLDFQLPKRFELEYQAPAPEMESRGLATTDASQLAVEGPVTPVLIHRAVLGSVERIMALLIEHYNGQWPFWLNPRQVLIATVNDSQPVVDFAENCRKIISGMKQLRGSKKAVPPYQHISVDIDASPRFLKKKISEAKRKRYAVIAVVGNQEAAANQLIVDFTAFPDFETTIGKHLALRHASASSEGATSESAKEGGLVEQTPYLTAKDLKSLAVKKLVPLAGEDSKDAPPAYEAATIEHGPTRNGPPTPGSKPPPRGPFPLDIPVLNQLRGKRVILASASPRRKQILSTIGLQNLEITPSTKPESLSKEQLGPFEYVLQTATQKCLDVYTLALENSLKSIPDPALVISADTVIVTNAGRILEKPRSEKDHIGMLKMLRDQRVHKCYTAVVALAPREDARAPGYNIETTVEETKVVFAANVSDELIEAYVKTREGVDKAGGYGLQGMGSLLVDRIEGSWDNVVGLPLRATLALIEKAVLNQEDVELDEDDE
ncbi:class II aaRS and biotin synthetase [Hyaloscypha variabilis]